MLQICLLDGSHKEQNTTVDYISCPIDCIYFNACTDDFSLVKSGLFNNTSALPAENTQAGVANFNEEGFQQAFEEDELVEAMNLLDDDSDING